MGFESFISFMKVAGFRNQINKNEKGERECIGNNGVVLVLLLLLLVGDMCFFYFFFSSCLYHFQLCSYIMMNIYIYMYTSRSCRV